MKSRQPRIKKHNSGSKLFRLAVVVIAVYSAVSILRLQAEVRQRRAELEEIMLKCEEQRLVNKDMELLISEGDNEDYIERTARERLDYVYPYETIFINASGS